MYNPTIIIHTLYERYIGWKFIPIAIHATMASTPIIVAAPIGTLRLYTRKPKIIAITINKSETIATEAFVSLTASLTAAPAALVVPNVPATIDANAATTRIRVRYAKIIKSLFALFPILTEIISPIDWPLWRSDANNAPKSCTPPKKMPPINTHKTTGTQPKIAAPIGPVIGPAPAIDEK